VTSTGDVLVTLSSSNTGTAAVAAAAAAAAPDATAYTPGSTSTSATASAIGPAPAAAVARVELPPVVFSFEDDAEMNTNNSSSSSRSSSSGSSSQMDGSTNGDEMYSTTSSNSKIGSNGNHTPSSPPLRPPAAGGGGAVNNGHLPSFPPPPPAAAAARGGETYGLTPLLQHGISLPPASKENTPWVLQEPQFNAGLVGAKALNLATLRRRLPPWVIVPASIALPFATFEAALGSGVNKGVKGRLEVMLGQLKSQEEMGGLPAQLLAGVRSLVTEELQPPVGLQQVRGVGGKGGIEVLSSLPCLSLLLMPVSSVSE
jgi:hypothetical protein